MNTNRLTESAQSHAPSGDNEGVFELVGVLRRQRWVILFFSLLGLAVGVAYAINATPWYLSTAKMLVNPKTSGLSNSPTADTVADDVLASHMEVLQSRRIVEAALEKDRLTELESIKPFLDESMDAVDYVINQLELTRGGGGAAKAARSLEIGMVHTDPLESQKILDSILVEYQKFIVNQVETVMSTANRLVNKAKDDVDTGLRLAEKEYMDARRNAPLLFQGEGSSNIYQEKYRRLEDELLNIDIEESEIRTRFDNVQAAIKLMENGSEQQKVDQLALIDGKSMERLGVFAGLKMNASTSAEFMAAQPERVAEAQAEYQQLLQLMSEKQRLSSVFGAQHPRVQDIDDEIALVKEFLSEKQVKLQGSVGLSELPLTPEALLRTYVGFLTHDLASIQNRKKELVVLSRNAEEQAKKLIDFEIEEQLLRNKIVRQEALFDGIVKQLSDLDTASGLSGYIYELLETPRLGIQVWPSLPLCGLGGLILGLLGGLTLAVANDVRDGRFRSSEELDSVIGMPMIARIEKLHSLRRGVKGLMATDLSPDAEAFRMGRTLLLPDIKAGKLKTIGWTSPMQGDGKSTVLSNFAVSLSQIGLKVLVIDADLRRPSQHRYFSVAVADGLTDIVEGRIDPDSVLKATAIENVSLITAGSTTLTPAELLQSVQFDKLLDDMSDQFDVVLIDLPPVLAVSDPLVVAPKVGGLVFVIRVSTARRDEVNNSLRRLQSAGANMVGCILNAYGAGNKFASSGAYFGYVESSYNHPPTDKRRPMPTGAVGPTPLSDAAITNGRVSEEVES